MSVRRVLERRHVWAMSCRLSCMRRGVGDTYHALAVRGDALGEDIVAQFLEALFWVVWRCSLEEQHIQIRHLVLWCLCMDIPPASQRPWIRGY